jgi:hypothetical protein
MGPGAAITGDYSRISMPRRRAVQLSCLNNTEKHDALPDAAPSYPGADSFAYVPHRVLENL